MDRLEKYIIEDSIKRLIGKPFLRQNSGTIIPQIVTALQATTDLTENPKECSIHKVTQNRVCKAHTQLTLKCQQCIEKDHENCNNTQKISLNDYRNEQEEKNSSIEKQLTKLVRKTIDCQQNNQIRQLLTQLNFIKSSYSNCNNLTDDILQFNKTFNKYCRDQVGGSLLETLQKVKKQSKNTKRQTTTLKFKGLIQQEITSKLSNIKSHFKSSLIEIGLKYDSFFLKIKQAFDQIFQILAIGQQLKNQSSELSKSAKGLFGQFKNNSASNLKQIIGQVYITGDWKNTIIQLFNEKQQLSRRSSILNQSPKLSYRKWKLTESLTCTTGLAEESFSSAQICGHSDHRQYSALVSKLQDMKNHQDFIRQQLTQTFKDLNQMNAEKLALQNKVVELQSLLNSAKMESQNRRMQQQLQLSFSNQKAEISSALGDSQISAEEKFRKITQQQIQQLCEVFNTKIQQMALKLSDKQIECNHLRRGISHLQQNLLKIKNQNTILMFHKSQTQERNRQLSRDLQKLKINYDLIRKQREDYQKTLFNLSIQLNNEKKEKDKISQAKAILQAEKSTLIKCQLALRRQLQSLQISKSAQLSETLKTTSLLTSRQLNEQQAINSFWTKQLTIPQKIWLKDIIQKRLLKTVVQFDLIYTASQHKFNCLSYHRNCDNLPNLLTIIRTEMGRVIGGFCDKIIGSMETSEVAFIFSVSFQVYMPIKKDRIPTANENGYGPIIGMDSDIRINQQNIFSNHHIPFASYEKVRVKGVEDEEILIGGKEDRVSEYEVFRVIYQ